MSTTETLLAAAVLAALAPSAAAQRQFEMLEKRGLPIATQALAMAAGDVDGDGDLDLVVGGTSVSPLRDEDRLYLNDGASVFVDATAARMPDSRAFTSSVGLGDVDADGDLDIVLVGRSQSRLYANDGTGAFTDVTAARMPSTARAASSVALGDVDGDGDLDIVQGSRQDGLFLNDGAGTFTDATATGMPVDDDLTASIVLGDVDGDGDLDLALGNALESTRPASGQNRLYSNDGSGRFTDATAGRMPVAQDVTSSVVLGDVDGDGDLDLVFGNATAFGLPAVSPQNRLYLNDGNGTFTDATARLPVDSDDTADVALVDVDGDADLDLVVGNWPGSSVAQRSRVYLNDGAGTFAEAAAARLPGESHFTPSLAFGDFDRDGDADLALGNSPRNALYVNDGSGGFADATAGRIPYDRAATVAWAVGDVDADGDADLVLGNDGYQNRLYANDGTAMFADATERLPSETDRTRALALGDVDRDGDLDLVVGNIGQQNRLYLNDGAGTFADATAARLPVDNDSTWDLAFGDVDADGDLDLIVGNYRPHNRMYLNDGTGVFTDATAGRMPIRIDSTLALALVDVDADDDLDLVMGNARGVIAPYTSGQDGLWLNDGTGVFTDVTAARMPVDFDTTSGVVAGDVDGDGDLDLAFANGECFYMFGRQDRLYLNDGTGRFTDVTAARMPVDVDYTLSVAIGDVDLDGDLDLVFGNTHLNCFPLPDLTGSSSRQDRLYLNDGAGTFVDASAGRMPEHSSGTYALELRDLDGDGDLDLLLGYSYLHVDGLYLNVARQLDAPFLARAGRPFQLDAYARYGRSDELPVAFPFLSTGTARLALPPLGTFGLDPASLIPLPPIAVDTDLGQGSLAFRIPNQASLAGFRLYTQALLIRGPGGSHLSNLTGDVLWR